MSDFACLFYIFYLFSLFALYYVFLFKDFWRWQWYIVNVAVVVASLEIKIIPVTAFTLDHQHHHPFSQQLVEMEVNSLTKNGISIGSEHFHEIASDTEKGKLYNGEKREKGFLNRSLSFRFHMLGFCFKLRFAT